MEDCVIMKKKEAAFYVLMREAHQDRLLGKESRVQNNVYRMPPFMYRRDA